MKELKNWDYPLDESLELCKKYGMIEASAFILERTGAVNEALNLQTSVYFLI